jgi:hypothetical protein
MNVFGLFIRLLAFSFTVYWLGEYVIKCTVPTWVGGMLTFLIFIGFVVFFGVFQVHRLKHCNHCGQRWLPDIIDRP